MAFAINIETESGDSYLYAFDGKPTQKEIIKTVKEKLGEEFEYISSYRFDATYDIEFKMKTS